MTDHEPKRPSDLFRINGRVWVPPPPPLSELEKATQMLEPRLRAIAARIAALSVDEGERIEILKMLRPIDQEINPFALFADNRVDDAVHEAKEAAAEKYWQAAGKRRAGRHPRSDKINEHIERLVVERLAAKEIIEEDTNRYIAIKIQAQLEEILRAEYLLLSNDKKPIKPFPWESGEPGAIAERGNKIRRGIKY